MDYDKRNRRISEKLKQSIFEKYDFRCTSCGISNDEISLELAHIVPLSQGGESSAENLTVLCPNCHNMLDRSPKEYEFINFLVELLQADSNFSNIKREAIIGDSTRYRADIIADENIEEKIVPILIECKSYTSFSSSKALNSINQIKTYGKYSNAKKLVLAVPATLIEKDKNILEANNIEVWDLQYIIKRFASQIKNAASSYYKIYFFAQLYKGPKEKRELELVDSLKGILPGKEEWNIYQNIVGEICECLFSPPLEKPIPESSDKSKANRRDFIIPNYSDDGFWSFLRTAYQADYIVVDAKNYKNPIKKTSILQISNYLKPHGVGLFAMIFSRKGGDNSGCEQTIREQWLINRKMILVFEDEEVIEMLVAKSENRSPESILSRKIEQFRLSM